MTKETIEKMRNQIEELCTTCAQDRGKNPCEGCPCLELKNNECYLVKVISNMTKQEKLEKKECKQK